MSKNYQEAPRGHRDYGIAGWEGIETARFIPQGPIIQGHRYGASIVKLDILVPELGLDRVAAIGGEVDLVDNNIAVTLGRRGAW